MENNHSDVVNWSFMSNIDNSKTKVALDLDGIKAQPTLVGGTVLV